ncbi:hypothetical protein VO54_00238 [Elizabethkingia miricola]|nr:hypothetical protein VO54_00238 [Elizabethkingia miricola]
MRKLYILMFIILGFWGTAQDLEAIAKEIKNEGIKLYRSEMASWYGTDVFLANYKNNENIGGYFSYINNNVPVCIFFSKENKVIGSVAFPANYNPKDSRLDLTVRDFTDVEREYFDIRQKALQRIKTDTIFRAYQNTNLNLIPIVDDSKNGQNKVYILTGTTQSNLVLFGNDYLITFNKNNEIEKMERLHNSLIPMKTKDEKGENMVSGVHSHILPDWLYITPTDICTLMLYQHIHNLESYITISKKYTSIWDCKNNNLAIMKTEDFEKMNKSK